MRVLLVVEMLGVALSRPVERVEPLPGPQQGCSCPNPSRSGVLFVTSTWQDSDDEISGPACHGSSQRRCEDDGAGCPSSIGSIRFASDCDLMV